MDKDGDDSESIDSEIDQDFESMIHIARQIRLAFLKGHHNVIIHKEHYILKIIEWLTESGYNLSEEPPQAVPLGGTEPSTKLNFIVIQL